MTRNRIKILLLSTVSLFLLQIGSIHADTQKQEPSTGNTRTQVQGSLQLKLEISDSDSTSFGIRKEVIENTVTQLLAQSNVSVTADTNAPSLLIRFKSVQASNVIASFVQVAFFEDAELLRGKTKIQAMTWSQATLLTSSKEDFAAETTKTINAMIQAFLQDYKKAFLQQIPAPAPKSAPMPEQDDLLPQDK